MGWVPRIDPAWDRAVPVLFALGGVLIVLPAILFFVLGGVCGCSVIGPPQAAFEYEVVERDGQPDALEITHDGGDSLASEQLYVVANTRFRAVDGDIGAGHRFTWQALGHNETRVSAGDQILIEPAGPRNNIHMATFDVRWWGEFPDEKSTWRLLDRWNPDATPALSGSDPEAETPVPSLPPPDSSPVRTSDPTDGGSLNGSNATR